MNQSATLSAENKNQAPQTSKTAEYSGGNVSYSTFGDPNSPDQKIFVIPGFSEDSVTMKEFAEHLTEGDTRQVIVTDQPHYNFKAGFTMAAIDHQAEANLAVIQAEGLDNEPLALVAHSLGAPILVRMAELAKERGITALDAEAGSTSVFLAPAGANRDEKLFLSTDSIAKRFIVDFMPRDAKEIKKYDPKKVGQKRAAKNLARNPLKTAKEVAYLGKKESTYKKLGKLGLKPAVVVFPDDLLQPQRLNQKITDAYVSGAEDISLSGWSTSVNLAGKGTGDKEAKDAWLDDYRHGGHNDHAQHPEHVADVVLQLLNHKNGSDLSFLKQATREFAQERKAQK